MGRSGVPFLRRTEKQADDLSPLASDAIGGVAWCPKQEAAAST